MGERGPKSTVVERLTPEQRAELDEAIVGGRETKEALFHRLAEGHGISERAFYRYAAQLEAQAKHRYVGELLAKAFGNLPDADIDIRARGIIMAVFDQIAADVLHDGELKPRDLRDVCKAYDLIRRGAIAEADEKRRQTEWEVVRMGAVAEAATWMKDTLKAEIGEDQELCDRLHRAVDAYCARIDQPQDTTLAGKLIDELAKKLHRKKGVREILHLMWGIKLPDDHGPRVLPAEVPPGVRQQVRDLYGLPDDNPHYARPPGGGPSRADVCQEIDDMARGKPLDDDSQ